MATITPRSSTPVQTANQSAPTQTLLESRAAPVLRLRGASRQTGEETHNTATGENDETSLGRHVQWSEDVVNNEGLGRKSSKACCIYHAPRGINESSDESSSDSSDADSESGDDAAARPPRRVGHSHKHKHNHNHKHDHKDVGDKPRSHSPNAYEKIPKVKSDKDKPKS